MWAHQCQATTTRGKQCTRKSVDAYHCFGFQGEKYSHATWVEVCGNHAELVTGQVSCLNVSKYRK